MQTLIRDGQRLYLEGLPVDQRPRILSREICIDLAPRHGCRLTKRHFDLLERTFFPKPPPDILRLHHGVDDGVTIGFAEIYRYALRRQGIEVPSFRPREIGAFSSNPPMAGLALSAAAEFVRDHDRGTIVVTPVGDLRAEVSATVVRAFPQSLPVLLAHSREKQQHIVEQFARLGVTCNVLGRNDGNVLYRQFSVGLPGDLADYTCRLSDSVAQNVGRDGEIGLEHVNLVLLWNDTDAAQNGFQEALLSLPHARVFGFTTDRKEIPPRTADRLIGTFGLDSLKLIDAYHLGRRVEHHTERHLNLRSTSRTTQGVAPLWQNHVRNRRLVGMARALAQGTFADADLDAAQRPRSVLLAVGLPGQLERLQRHRGLRLLDRRACRFGVLRVAPGEVGLVLADDFEYVDFSSIDAVVWGGGGKVGFDVDDRLLIVDSVDTQPLRLVDLRDEGHGIWRYDARRRIAAYRSREWFRIGEDVATARIERFLAQPHRQVRS